MFSPHHFAQIIASDIGVVLWLAGLAGFIWNYGFADVFRLYLVPYLWYVYQKLTSNPTSNPLF